MRTIAWETAPQIALRNCSQGVGGKVSIYACDFHERGIHTIKQVFFHRRLLLVTRSLVVTRKDFSAFLDMKRYKNCAH